MIWRFFKKRSGFTVVEMLVVLGITAALSGLFVGYGVNLKDQIALFRDEAQVIQTLFKTKTFSIQVRKNEEGGTFCAYGFHIDNSREYFVYGKNDCSTTYEWRESFDEKIGQTQRVDGRVDLNIAGGSIDLVFIPPIPKIHDGGGSFDMCTQGDGVNRFCRRISVNSVGQIDSDSVNN